MNRSDIEICACAVRAKRTNEEKMERNEMQRMWDIELDMNGTERKPNKVREP